MKCTKLVMDKIDEKPQRLNLPNQEQTLALHLCTDIMFLKLKNFKNNFTFYTLPPATRFSSSCCQYGVQFECDCSRISVVSFVLGMYESSFSKSRKLSFIRCNLWH